MGFVKIFWKNNAQDTFLPEISIWGQIDLFSNCYFSRVCPPAKMAS